MAKAQDGVVSWEIPSSKCGEATAVLVRIASMWGTSALGLGSGSKPNPRVGLISGGPCVRRAGGSHPAAPKWRTRQSRQVGWLWRRLFSVVLSHFAGLTCSLLLPCSLMAFQAGMCLRVGLVLGDAKAAGLAARLDHTRVTLGLLTACAVASRCAAG